MNDNLVEAILNGTYESSEISPLEARSVAISLQEIQFLTINLLKLSVELGEDSILIKAAKR